MISCRTLEWSRELAWRWDRDEDGVMALCCGDEEGGMCGLRRGLVALEGYICLQVMRTKAREAKNQLALQAGGVEARLCLCLHEVPVAFETAWQKPREPIERRDG